MWHRHDCDGGGLVVLVCQAVCAVILCVEKEHSHSVAYPAPSPSRRYARAAIVPASTFSNSTQREVDFETRLDIAHAVRFGTCPSGNLLFCCVCVLNN